MLCDNGCFKLNELGVVDLLIVFVAKRNFCLLFHFHFDELWECDDILVTCIIISRLVLSWPAAYAFALQYFSVGLGPTFCIIFNKKNPMGHWYVVFIVHGKNTGLILYLKCFNSVFKIGGA